MFNILYVDDEPHLLNIAKLYLEKKLRYTVTTAISAGVAIEILSGKGFDAIISDYQMPGMNGIEFLKQIRSSGDDIPFIIFTGRGREEIVIEALNEGADFYLQKGGDFNAQFAELSHKVHQAVHRREADRKIRDHERLESDIINFLPDATFAIDTGGHVIIWNRAIEEMTGVPARDMVGKGDYEYSLPFYGERRPILVDLVSLPDEDLKKEWYSVITREGNVLIAETTLPRPLGKSMVLLGKASHLFNEDGKIIGAIESIRDISGRAQAERALKESEVKYRTLSGNIPGMIYRARPDWSVEFILNPERVCGYAAGDFTSETVSWLNLIHHEDRERIFHESSGILWKEDTIEQEYRIRDREGKTRWVSDRKTSFFGKDGSFIGIDGIVFDITERKQGEIALRESEQKYRSVIENIQDAYYRSDRDGNLIMVSPSGVAMFGCASIDEILGKPIAEIFYARPEDRAKFLATLDIAGAVRNYETCLRKSDGTAVPVSITSHYYYDTGGAIAGVEGIIRDITALKQEEERTREQARRLSILNEIITSANQAESRSELLKVFLDKTLQLLDYDGGGVYLVDSTGETASLVLTKNLPEEFVSEVRTVNTREKHFYNLFIMGEPIISDNYSELRPDIARFGIRSVASIPLVAKDQVIGALNVGSYQRDVITDQEREILISIGRELGTTIRRMTS